MAELLTNHFNESIPVIISDMIRTVHPSFDHSAFITDALNEYEPLNLMDRGRKIAHSLHRFLPENYETSIAILIGSLAATSENPQGKGHMASFLFLPHSFFISTYGLSHFEASMQAQYLLTQRFTAEFCIRPFLTHYTEATLQRLQHWISDPNEHVRRLVSEGTRPRLPWASRLWIFQKDPSPVLALLEELKDDPHEYVRRSVANNLNDIGKDHPDLLLDTTKRWLVRAPENRRRLVRHALRTAIKEGQPQALEQLGFGKTPKVFITEISISPQQPRIGEAVALSFVLKNHETITQKLLVDFRIHYQKANGTTNAKVFKLKEIELEAHDQVYIKKNVSLAPMTTRTHYPGEHRVELLINGHPFVLGLFHLQPG